MTLAAALLGAPLWLATAVAATPTQKISVDVRGPVALVQVTRTLPFDENPGGERLLDVALPERAALVDVEIGDAGQWRAAAPTDGDHATHAYVDRLASRGVTPTRAPFDEGTRLRLRALGAPGASIDVRYRFATLVDVSEGRERLRFPAAPERVPVPADVLVRGADATVVEIAGVRRQRGHVSTRGAWEISWPAAASAPARSFALAGSLVTAKVAGKTEALAAVVAEARQRRISLEPPPNVLLLIDRSRSVGLPGLAAERDLARKLLEELPPATRFDALFFDRGTRRLFPLSRPATREAMGALDAEMVPDRLANGTDLAGALRDAGALLRREASAFAPRTLLTIVSDGALPERADGAALTGALGATTGVDVTVAAFVVRPKGDEPAARAAVAALRALAASRGGVVRELATDELDDGLPPALAALASGGDLADVRLVARDGTRAIADALAPGQGRAVLLKLEKPSDAFALVATSASPIRLPLRPQKIDAAALGALAGGTLGTRLVTTDDLIALVEPVP
ncbi:MAG TPA: vWA domain-containing protein, partial [Polyangia bacterium]|nr:vWA domain-containing protein [Polyangia bacterium]